VFLSLDFVKVRRSLIEVRREFAVMFASILTNRRAESPDVSYFAGGHSELLLIFFRVGVGRHRDTGDSGRAIPSRPRSGPPGTRSTVLCQLLSKLIGLLTKRLGLTAKFRQFRQLVLGGRAVCLSNQVRESLVFRRQYGQLVVLLPQDGVAFAEFALGPVLNHQRCRQPADQKSATTKDDFELCHICGFPNVMRFTPMTTKGQHPKNLAAHSRANAPSSSRGGCADPGPYSQEPSV